MEIIRKIDNALAKFESWLLVGIVLVMVTLSFMQVILRNFFAEGILWGDTFLRHLVLWVGFIGASLATREKKHINIDVFGRLLKGKIKIISDVIINLFASFIALYLGRAAWSFVMEEKEYATTLFNEIPVWPFQIIIPIGFLLMAIRFLLIALEGLGNKEAGQ